MRGKREKTKTKTNPPHKKTTTRSEVVLGADPGMSFKKQEVHRAKYIKHIAKNLDLDIDLSDTFQDIKESMTTKLKERLEEVDNNVELKLLADTLSVLVKVDTMVREDKMTALSDQHYKSILTVKIAENEERERKEKEGRYEE